uniref:Uncharacterized protein n=1 Tax=Caenorhabditis tropicalis TaxID=1561998 RepID=A0A1I7TQ83_9PELO
MNRIETVCERLEALIVEKEKLNLEQMSESGSEGKYVPSPSGSRESPVLNGKPPSNGGSRKRKPTKESVNRLFDHENGSPVEKRQVPTPVQTRSPFELNGFNGFVFDPMANPQNMMQLLNLVQQQQSQQVVVQQKAPRVEEEVKQEENPQTPPEQNILDQIAAQFNGVGIGVN